MAYESDYAKFGRVLKSEKITDLSNGYAPEQPFSVFLVPKEGSDVELGDVVVLESFMPLGTSVTPVTVGIWSPGVFVSLAAGAVDLTKVDLYVGTINQ